MDGSVIFARWRQCAIPCGHIGAIWWIRLNLCFHRPTRVNNPNGKSIGSTVSVQLTAENPYTLQWATLSPQNAPSYGGSWSHLIHHLHSSWQSVVGYIGTTWWIRLNLYFLWPTGVHNPNCKSIGSAIFAQLMAESSYTLQWETLSPKIALPIRGSGLPFNMIPWHIWAHNPNGIWIG